MIRERDSDLLNTNKTPRSKLDRFLEVITPTKNRRNEPQRDLSALKNNRPGERTDNYAPSTRDLLKLLNKNWLRFILCRSFFPLSICICGAFRRPGGVVDRRERLNFDVRNVPLEEIVSPFGIREFHQVLEDIICTCINRLIVFSEAGVSFWANCWTMVVFISFVMEDHIAPPPLLEPHCAQHVVVWQRVESIKCISHSLFRTKTCLEACCASSWWESCPVHNVTILKSPGLKKYRIHVFWLEPFISMQTLVEIEALNWWYTLPCRRGGTSL